MKREAALGLAAVVMVGLLLAVAVRAPGNGEPAMASRFIVDIDGMDALNVREVFGLHCETGIAEALEEGASSPTLLPDLTRCGPLVLRRNLTSDTQLADWYAAVVGGDVDRRDGTITILDEEGEPVATYAFTDAWPAAYGTDPLLAWNPIPAIEEVVLAVEQIQRVE